MAQPVPEGFHTLSPHLVVKDCAKAIEFYKGAFGATVRKVHFGPDKTTITHADLQIGDSVLMLNDVLPEWGILSPLSPGGGSASCTVHIYAEDIDALWTRSLEAGARVKLPLADQFWGDRYGKLIDPFGHQWSLAAHVADVTEQEIREATVQAFSRK